MYNVNTPFKTLRKNFKQENKSGYRIILLLGFLVPIISGITGSDYFDVDSSGPVLVSILLYWFLVYPSLIRSYFISRLLFRIIIFIGLWIPILSGEIHEEFDMYFGEDFNLGFLISSFITWIVIRSFIWIYGGYRFDNIK